MTANDTADIFNGLYANYKHAVYRFALYLTQNRQEAEEIYQETWLKVIENLANSKEIKKPEAWMMTVTANSYKDGLRKKKVRRLFFRESIGSDRSSGQGQRLPPMSRYAGHPEDDRIETKTAIQKALQKLRLKERQVFILKEIEGYKQDEVAAILNIPSGTVKSIMYRAVRQMRVLLAEYQPQCTEIHHEVP
jgi:RNA polymerase sigma-70 factor (ECF subfamily)